MTDPIVNALSLTVTLTPVFLFATLGEIVSEKSGVANLGIEGLMLLSAYASFAVDAFLGNPLLAILIAMATAGVFGVIFCALTLRLRTDVVATGLGLWLFGVGFSFVLFRTLPVIEQTKTIPLLGPVTIPILSPLPILGPILFQQNPLVYIGLALVPLVSLLLNRTPLGLRIRAVGENPKAADTMGVNVQRIRFLAVMVGVLLMGLSGAYFQLGGTPSGAIGPGQFNINELAGRGFIALAMVYFANWNAYKALSAIFLYNLVDSLQSYYGALPGMQGYNQLFAILPYLLVIALIPILGRKARAPKYLNVPYTKG